MVKVTQLKCNNYRHFQSGWSFFESVLFQSTQSYIKSIYILSTIKNIVHTVIHSKPGGFFKFQAMFILAYNTTNCSHRDNLRTVVLTGACFNSQSVNFSSCVVVLTYWGIVVLIWNHIVCGISISREDFKHSLITISVLSQASPSTDKKCTWT